MAASMATQEATWLRYLLSGMGYGDLRIQEFGKLCEEDYKKALDLGAWGPRFKRTAAPGAFGKAWVASFWMGGRPPPPAARYE